MKNFVLFYHNPETGISGVEEFQGKSYDWIFGLWDSMNPMTIVTIIEV